jgi:polysaccharide chain length determinant protein (PEP-CTERM system associated)
MMSACSQSADLEKLKKQLSDLLVDFTEKHPRVVTLHEQIATIEGRCTSEEATTNLPSISRPQGDEPLELNPVYQNLRIQLSTAEVELAEAKRTLRSHQDAVASLRRDVDKIAQVETDLKQLNRDYDVVQQRHKELLRRWEDLQAKKRLDPVTDNVQFRRIEPPFALADPVGPKRPMFLTAVFLLGLAAGGAVAFGLNKLYPAYFSRRSVRQMSGLPVLGSISMLLTPQAIRHRRAASVVWLAAYALLFVSTGLVIGFSSQAAALVRAALAAGGL